MRALVAMLLVVPLPALAASPLDEAVQLAVKAERTSSTPLLAEAAMLPWPTVPPGLDAKIAAHFSDLPASAQHAWAIDRALPILAGELKASDATTRAVLDELRRSASRQPGELAVLDEARRSYAQHDMARAVARYEQITQSSPLWPEALRERAWAQFVEGRPAEALGATVSLAAPYFPTEDQAEARLLKATVLLSKCRFEEARELVAPLAGPVPAALAADEATAAIESNQPPPGEVAARAFDSPLVRRVRLALADRPVDAAGAAWRAKLVKLGATLFSRAYADQREAARSLTERALDVRYEALHGERALLESGSTIGKPKPPRPGTLGDDDVAWSFDGSYWRDELGRYRYAAGDACPRGDRR